MDEESPWLTFAIETAHVLLPAALLGAIFIMPDGFWPVLIGVLLGAAAILSVVKLINRIPVKRPTSEPGPPESN